MSDSKLTVRVRAKILTSLLFIVAAVLPAAAQGGSRPSASVDAGARRSPDVAVANRAGNRCDRYVSTAGADANTALTARVAWRTIGKALRTLRAGEVGCVLPGTYERGAQRGSKRRHGPRAHSAQACARLRRDARR